MSHECLRGYYSKRYAVPGVFPYARLMVTAERIRRLGFTELIEPAALDPQMLIGLHDELYLKAFKNGTGSLASSQGLPWSEALRDATYDMLSGQLEAVSHALKAGIAFNVARGFHHAVPQRGSGFCAINGFALVAHRLPGLKVFVVDCDEHGGNGTEEFSFRMPNLYCASIFGTRFGCLGGPRSWNYHVSGASAAADYRKAVDDVLERVRANAPDLLIYQAGVDCHIDDPKASVGLSTRELFLRDLTVFSAARELGIPLVFVFGGGYQQPERVAFLNANTVRAARHAYRVSTSPPRMPAN